MSRAPASWGRWPRTQQQVQALHSRCDPLSFDDKHSYLPHGLGRSYGDSCLNDGGVLLATRGLDRYISFDAQRGELCCEAGVSLQEIAQLVLPQGWFLPVSPGTQFVTVGGAIANDVHGKNHHRAGSFGRYVLEFELLRSDGSVHLCSPSSNADLYGATIGGLGLTGLIRWARLQLRPVPGPWLTGERIKFGNLGEFFTLARDSDRDYEYTVAWVDCSAGGSARGRGLYSRGNHAAVRSAEPREARLSMPLTPPLSLVNRLSVAAFNRLNYARQRSAVLPQRWHWRPFFYPLDGIENWNRMYGPRGFFQYQCVVPLVHAHAAIDQMLARIARAGEGSFLAVLKLFGDLSSPGWLSFPRAGATLAIDFPNRGART
ncbi:MAG TPA: FAD-binding oxidoreductase, partial [Nevskiaceae bacterium]|nr:FAD-binding oxidoreductase [Nevskiaceae bacterium]